MGPVFLILGIPGVGKSTVCHALMSRFERGLHIRVDDLRHMVVAGLCDMGFDWSDGLAQQLSLARDAAAHMAVTYAQAGFAVAVDDFWHGDVPDSDYQGKLELAHRVVVHPSLPVALDRLHGRNRRAGLPEDSLEDAVLYAHPILSAHSKAGWCLVDSSDLDVQQTVDVVLNLVVHK